MSAKSTPGPWKAVQYEKEGGVWGVRQATGLGFSICNIVEQDTDSTRPEEAANAELIAAAPETLRQRDALLEAAIKIAGFVEEWKEALAGLQMTEEDFARLSGLSEITTVLADCENAAVPLKKAGG